MLNNQLFNNNNLDNLKILKIDNLTIKIDRKLILKNINLEVYKGDFLGIVGESGSGKTTLAKACLGLINPTMGKILFYNKEITKLNKYEKRKIGVIFQDPFSSFNPVKNIFSSLFAVLYYVCNIKDVNKAKELIKDLFIKFELNFDLIYRFPYEVSGGQLQRIAIIRTLLLNPEIIVADEPTSALDANTKLAIIKILSNLPTTFIYITHDINTLKYFEGKIGVIYKGELVELANLKQGLDKPLHPYFRLLLNKDNYEKNNVFKEYNDLQDKDLSNRGCVFYSRCKYSISKCKEEKPILKDYKGRLVACHLIQEIEY